MTRIELIAVAVFYVMHDYGYTGSFTHARDLCRDAAADADRANIAYTADSLADMVLARSA